MGLNNDQLKQFFEEIILNQHNITLVKKKELLCSKISEFFGAENLLPILSKTIKN